MNATANQHTIIGNLRVRGLEFRRFVRKNSKYTLLVLAVLIGLMGFATITQTTRVAQTGHEIDLLLRERTRLERQQKSLMLQIADAQSMQRIELYAKETKMIPNQDVNIQYMILKNHIGQLRVESVVIP